VTEFDTEPSGSPTAHVVEREELSVVEVANFFLRNLAVFILLPFLFGVGVIAKAYLIGRDYVATSSFLSEGAEGGGYSSLAAQFGVSLTGGEAGSSVEFYEALLNSRGILAALATSRMELVEAGGNRRSGTLLDLLEIAEEPASDRMRRGLRELRAAIAVRPNPTAGILEVATTASSPQLAELMNRRLLDLVVDFNIRRRQATAAAEQSFAAERLQAAQSELRDAERAFERFLELNRTYQSSPQLVVQAARLQRTMEMRQQVFLSLSQSHEQARIDAVRNTPVISLITAPEGTAERGRLLPSLIIAGMTGLILAGLIAGIREWLSRLRRKQPAEYAALRGQMAAVFPTFLR
jgi:uncharacterized protein involved in exopolysaccharide biosynthesis